MAQSLTAWYKVRPRPMTLQLATRHLTCGQELPPVTRCYLTAAVGITALCYFEGTAFSCAL
jgi:hypothetical protein